MRRNSKLSLLTNNLSLGWVIVIVIFSIITLPRLFMDGMFMDAVQYSAIAKNLAHGFGTFWFPMLSVYNVAGMPAFLEQPPLFFGILSVFFRIFGDSLYTERIYLLINLLISFWLIKKIWEELFPDKIKQAWLAVLVYITNPIFFWSSVNLVIENTMLIFTSSAILFILRFYKKDASKSLNIILAGFFIYLATLTKGVPGLFPLVIPSIFHLFNQKKNLTKTIANSLILLLIPALLYFLMLVIFPKSQESFSFYFYDRLIGRIQQEPVVGSRFYILNRLLLDLSPIILICLGLFIFNKLKPAFKPKFSISKEFFFLLIIGISASLPLILTLVQRRFYYLPSIPIFSIAFASIIADQIKIIPSLKLKKIIHQISIALIIIAIGTTITLAGKPWRDKDVIEDVNTIGNIVNGENMISIHPNLWTNWSIQCYMMRYWGISLDPLNHSQYFITDRNSNNSVPLLYKLVKLDTNHLLLYKKDQPE